MPATDWFEPSTLATHEHRCRQRRDQRYPALGTRRTEHPLQRPTHRRLADRLGAGDAGALCGRFDVEASISGELFVTKPGPMVDILRQAIARATGIEPKLDTGGGTSDARFIARYCPVAEFGLVGATMHQTDECVPVAELRDLAHVYHDVIAAFLA